MKSKIYIITRFNAPCFPKRKDLAERRLNDDWLRERVRLFKQYCYPSVVNQRWKEFIWIVWCHPDSPLWMKQELYGMDGCCFTYADSYYDKIDTDVDTLVTIRLDNDDMIHKDFIGTIVKHLATFKESGLPRQVYSFTKGYRYFDAPTPKKPKRTIKWDSAREAGSLVEVEMHNNPFLAMFANLKKKPVRNTDHLVYHTDHGKMCDLFNTIYNHDLRAWAWVYHGGNTAAIQCKSGDTVDNKILKNFGVGK